MTGMYVVIGIGIVIVGLTGFVGKRKPSNDLADILRRHGSARSPSGKRRNSRHDTAA